MNDKILNAGGRVRKLKFNTKAIRQAERELGVGLPTILQRMWGNDVSLDTLFTLLWAGCLHEEPGLRPDTVEQWFPFEHMTEWYAEVLTAVMSSLGEAMSVEEKKTKTTKPSSGKASK